MITFDQLLHAQPQGVLNAGEDLHKCAEKLARGRIEYRNQVLQPVAAGSIWSDAAQPDAVAVLTVMTRAFEVGSVQMSAGASALATLSIELAAAKQAAQEIERKANRSGLKIENGYIGIDPGTALGAAHGGSAAAAAQIPNLQGLLNVAVQRAEDADNACSKFLKDVAWSDFVVGTHNGGNLVARANAAVDAAYATLDRVGKLRLQLARQAQRNLERELDDADGIDDVFVGTLKGLWSGYANTITLLATLVNAGVGNDHAQRKLGQIAKNLQQMGIGEAFDVQALKEGRIGEFIGENLWWFVPGGGAFKGGKALGKGGGVVAKSGEVVGKAASRGGRVVDPHTGKAIDPGDVAGSIAHGHAYEKHVVKKGEYPGIASREEFQELGEKIVKRGEMRKLSNGRTAWYYHGTVVIRNPGSPDGGTMFRPRLGYKYFEEELD